VVRLKIFFTALLGIYAQLYSSVGPTAARTAYRGLRTPLINTSQRRLMSSQMNEKLLERLKTSIDQKDMATADQTLTFIKATRPDLLAQAEAIYAGKQIFTQKQSQQKTYPQTYQEEKSQKTEAPKSGYKWPKEEKEGRPHRYPSYSGGIEWVEDPDDKYPTTLRPWLRSERDKEAKEIGEFLEQNWDKIKEAKKLDDLIFYQSWKEGKYFEDLDDRDQKRVKEFKDFTKKATDLLRNYILNGLYRRPQLQKNANYFYTEIKKTNDYIDRDLFRERPKPQPKTWPEKVADWFKNKQR